MLTLAQTQNSSIANVAGCNVTDPQFAQLVNDAVQQLMDIPEHGWWGTVQHLIGCVQGNCLVWPSKIDSVLAMRLSDREIRLSNFWYEYVPDCRSWDESVRHWRRGQRHNHVTFNGTTPLFIQPNPQQPMVIQFTTDSAADVNRFITVYGLDTNGHEVFSVQQPGGTLQRGMQLVLGGSGGVPCRTTVPMTHVSAIIKDVTVGPVRAWNFVPNTGLTGQIGMFRGGDTSVEYWYTALPHSPCIRSVAALVRLGFQPAISPSDILSIDCLDAIKFQVQAIRARDAGDGEKSLFYEKMAVRRLQMQMKAKFPQEQFVLDFLPFGRRDQLTRQKIGRLV